VRQCFAAALAGLALLLARGAAAAEPEPPPSLEALMAGMAGTSGVEARFVETKEIALLAKPIQTRGTIVFVPPDRLARTTTEPSRTRLVIVGDRFGFRDEAGGDAVDLSANPLAREFVTNFIVLFNGDLAALQARYDTEFHADASHWSLVLRPRGRPLSDLIERVTLTGAGREMTAMELRETDGDRTATRFEDVRVDRRFTPEELERLFAMPTANAGAP